MIVTVGAAALTVIVGEVPLCPSYVPVIVTVPDDDTVATAGSLEDQRGLMVALVPSLYVAVAYTVVVAPTVNVVSEALTSRLVTVLEVSLDTDSVGAISPEGPVG